MKNISYLFFVILVFACGKNSDTQDPGNNVSVEIGPGQSGIVGTSGISAWDGLNLSEKNRIIGCNTLFLHQSVGQDLEEGCKANGFPWEYYGNGDQVNRGFMGGIFVDVGNIPKGNPYEKIRVFKEQILKNKDVVKIGIFKFGYADIDDDNYSQVQTAYKTMVDEIKSKVPDFRMIHVTPPLVFSVESFDGNGARMKVGSWMRATFASSDVVFDLQALESNDGNCQENGIWRICTENRNTEADPSDVNGIDTSPGQGHIGKKAGQKISKSLLMSIYNAGK